jgi:cytochrome c-type biogenesis protein CcmH
MLFWIPALVLVLGSLMVVFAPMLRGTGRGAARASYDMQVYRDQLREIDTELARGVLTESEAEATRAEVSRRLLAAADAEGGDSGGTPAPRRVSTLTGGALLIGVAAMASALYFRIGVPGFDDQPLAERMATMAEQRANRPGQAEAEAAFAASGRSQVPAISELPPEDVEMVDQLKTILEDRPDDLRGHRLLVGSMAALGRFGEAWVAQERVVELEGEDVPARDLVNLAELMILAAGGYVSPEAEAALTRGMQLNASDPLGRYYSGVALLQGGRADLAFPIWSGLLREGPADAPWIPAIEAQLPEVARLAGQPLPEPAPGPTREDIEAASEMSEEDRAAMIGSMVAQLSDRIATQGGPASDWARLITALTVLDRADEAEVILDEARQAFFDDPAGLEMINGAAAQAGLGQ